MSGCNGCDDEDAVLEINTQTGALPLNYIPQSYPSGYVEPVLSSNPSCITPQCPPPAPPPNLPVIAHPVVKHPPVPHYIQASMCPEDNRQIINNLLFTTVLKSSAPLNMPGCGATADVVFQGLRDISINSRLWAYNIGYLTVTAFNPNNATVTLRNDCDNACGDQAAAGTLIPACTPFIVTVPPCVSSGTPSSNFPFLAAQFTAPANGNCVDITVTNTNGLQVGKDVQIAGGTYLLQAIISSTLITVCNNGLGVTPGTVVEFEDEDGTLITPVIPVDQNPCTNDTTETGALLICDGGTARPLTGTAAGQVPVLLDPITGVAEYQTLGVETLQCTSLDADFTTDSSNPPTTPYIVTVGNSFLFPVNNYVTIGTQVFTVYNHISATQFRLIPDPVPAGIVTFNAGVQVCEAACCEVLSRTLGCADPNRLSQVFEVGHTGHESGPPAAAATMPENVGTTVGDFVGTTSSAGIIVTNTSTCRNMAIKATWNGTCFGNLIGGKYDNEFATIEFRLIRTINGVPTPVATLAQHMIGFDNSPHRFDVQRMWVHTMTLLPGQTVSFDGAMQAVRLGGNATYQVFEMGYLIEVIAVAA